MMLDSSLTALCRVVIVLLMMLMMMMMMMVMMMMVMVVMVMVMVLALPHQTSCCGSNAPGSVNASQNLSGSDIIGAVIHRSAAACQSGGL
ncbi:hypothetical protein EYF80_022395 [Liparis tanakae]|uniref:Uncharacterized protein n=1 Tax=Liparis tanakae TaxID=230148 RepID=A0A4Z2HNM4_9TELE|nr:hypothetical protein EYF80_022395 [Liparis tanakae]